MRRVVYAAQLAYGDQPTLPKVEHASEPLFLYAVAKLWASNTVRSSRVYGLETVSLRYFNVFGPRGIRVLNIPA